MREAHVGAHLTLRVDRVAARGHVEATREWTARGNRRGLHHRGPASAEPERGAHPSAHCFTRRRGRVSSSEVRQSTFVRCMELDCAADDGCGSVVAIAEYSVT